MTRPAPTCATARPADDAVTIRDLLTHTAGVDSPGELFADRVPDLVTLTGPVVQPAGPRGAFSYSNGGYALLGQLIADVTGGSYPEAATGLVLGPLGMSGSSFPAMWPATGAVTGYLLAGDGSLSRPRRRCAPSRRPAASGRPPLTWCASACPGRPCSPPRWPVKRSGRRWTGTPPGRRWAWAGCSTSPRMSAGTPGGGPGAASSLIIRRSTGQPSVALANRLVPIEPVNARLVRPPGNAGSGARRPAPRRRGRAGGPSSSRVTSPDGGPSTPTPKRWPLER